MTTETKTPKTKGKKPAPFADQVLKAIGKRPLSTAEIAVKLKLVDENGKATNYGKSKTLAAIKQLITAEKVVQEGAFKTAKYKLA